MAEDSSVNDVFRFIQLRPRRTVPEAAPILLLRDTALVKRLTSAGSKRYDMANAALASGPVKSIADVPLGEEITTALRKLRDEPDATTNDLRQQLPGLSGATGARDFPARLAALSDTLLATYFATAGFPADLPDLQNAYRVFHLPPAAEPIALTQFLGRPLLAPVMPRAGEPRSAQLARETNSDDGERSALTSGIEELARLDRRELLEQPDENGHARDAAMPFTLTETARTSLSGGTATLLRERGIDLATTPVDIAVQTLSAEKLKFIAPIKWPHPPIVTQPGITLPPAPAHALVRPAGVADLLVVKQQIKRYEAAEIAHVENVLAKEKKSRAHRRLERSEETFSTETETTRTQETELETADRFELNRETSRTVENDMKHGFGLSLSGKYGPTVEFTANATAEQSSHVEETNKNSSRYAKDVMSRSLERLTERIRETRTRTVVRETEETNLHDFTNESGQHVSGIYQFLDKVYEAQVFNYGIREMFDFMIPEPASFWWYVDQNPTLDVDLPPPPKKLDTVCPNPSYLHEDLALALAAEFGAIVEPPPQRYMLTTVGFKHGEDNASEEHSPRGVQRGDLTIAAGYRPLRARVRVLAFTDEHPVIAVGIGSAKVVWEPGPTIELNDEYRLAHQPMLSMNLDAEPYAFGSDSKLAVSVIAWETNTYTIDITAVATRTEEHLQQWRVTTYNKIRAAYEDRVREHAQKVEALRAEAEARAERENRMPFGAPPAANRQTINIELKKHCISMITQQRYDAFDATKDGAPPFFHFEEAAAEGAYIRFFEQAFEWDQIQYVFYPYFWARKSATWIDRFTKQDVDPLFQEFLRAGAARVVVPVRPGFEIAVTHFLETGKIWGGEGEPPQINTPLYVSIIDEIRERTGAPKGEKAVGDPWDVRVPTALVLVRPGTDLPKWKRTAPDEWSWLPEEGNA